MTSILAAFLVIERRVEVLLAVKVCELHPTRPTLHMCGPGRAVQFRSGCVGRRVIRDLLDETACVGPHAEDDISSPLSSFLFWRNSDLPKLLWDSSLSEIMRELSVEGGLIDLSMHE